MNKKSFLLLMLIFFTCDMLLAQNTEIKPVKFKKISKEIKKKKSPYYYPLLFQRYLELDTSLTAEEFKYLYYGFSFQAEYQPYGTPLLRDAIMSTGDGLSENTAFVVIYIPDEYEILEVLGFKFGGSQSLIEGNYDLLEIDQNPYGITEIYFDVSRLLSFEF